MREALRKRARSLGVSLALALAAIFVVAPAALADTIVVNGSCVDTNLATAICDDNTTYRTIAGAVGATVAGDVISVTTPVSHTEAGVTITHAVSIIGQGQNTTIWQAATGPGIAATRLFTVNPSVAVTVTSLTLQYGYLSSGYGGAILNQRGTLTLDRVNVYSNTAASSAGAIYNAATANGATARLVLTGTVFSHNQALGTVYNDGGGAIRNEPNGTGALASILITNSQFISNSSPLPGGGIYNYAGDGALTLTITNSVFLRNSSTTDDGGGGAIYTFGIGDGSSTATVRIEGSQFISNTAAAGGGAVGSYGRFSAVALAVTNTVFSYNRVTDDFYGGGGIYNLSNSTAAPLTVANSQFYSNTAPQGMGVQSEGTGLAPTLINNSIFAYNQGTDDFYGGSVAGDATLTLQSSQFYSNTAGRGAALQLDGTALVTDGVFNYNTTTSDGGAINNGGTLTLLNSVVLSNTAGGSGGGLTNSGTLNLQNTDVYSNTSYEGGGGALRNTGTAHLLNALITRNRAFDSFYGGGAIISSGSLVITNSQLISNSMLGGGGGGAIDVQGYSSAPRVTLLNTPVLSNTTAGEGGAVFLHALDDGGAVYLTVISSTVAYNTAGGSNSGGGAIYAEAANRDGASTLAQVHTILTDTVVHTNRATGTGSDGGAIFSQALGGNSNGRSLATVQLFNTTLSNNSAAGTAGAVYVDVGTGAVTTTVIANSLLTMTHATAYSNTAGSGGGALYVDSFQPDEVARADLFNTVISGNSGNECSGSGTLAGAGNYIDDTSCGSGAPYRLGSALGTVSALANNGGPTWTNALQNASPAVNGANGTYCLPADQRGTARPQGAACDAGAWEGVPVTPTLFISGTPTSGMVGVGYNYTFTTNGFLVTFTVQSGSLPPGLALNPNGVLSGTPTLAGSYGGLVVRASNGVANVDTSALTILVSEIFTVTANPPDGQVGSFYTYTITATTSPLTYTLQSGTLPPGLTLGTNGVLSGTPTVSGTYSGIVFRGSSAGSYDDSDVQTIIITQTVTLVNANPPDGQRTVPYNYTLTGTGNPLTYTVASGSLPPGLSLTSAGVLTGTPSVAGTYNNIVFRANNGYDTDDSAPQTIIITETVTITANPPGGTVNEFYSYSLSGSGGTASTFSVVAGTLPPGLTLDPDGTLSGTPTAAGTYSGIVFRADNGYDTDDSPARTIEIEAAVDPLPFKMYLPGMMGPPPTPE